MNASLRSSLAGFFKGYFKHALGATFALALVFALTPLIANALDVDVTTAQGNETSTDNVLGGIPTRVTWEAVVDKGEQVSSVTLQFPEGSSLSDETTVRTTVLDDTTRLDVESTESVDTANASVTVDFSTTLKPGQRLRLQIYNATLPNVNGNVNLTGTYKLADGTQKELAKSPDIEVSQASVTQKIVNWLDDQPWCQAWNSVTFLRLFFEPQLIVSSIPVVFWGWLISLGLVAVGFPLAIPIGLCAAFMKISRSRILHAIAAIYTGIIRGTPLFLQIYIAFFGSPLIGININQYLLAILVMSFNSGAYMCEILRAGIQSIPKGQFEAARSLGMTQSQTMFSVIIPQMVRRVIPTMTSEFILLYKDTSLLAAVGVMELMLYSRSVVANTGNMTPYIVAAFFYLIVTLPLIHVVTKLENRLAGAEGPQSPDASKEKKVRKNRRGAFAQMKEELSEPVGGDDAQEGAPAANQVSENGSDSAGALDAPADDSAEEKGDLK